MRKMLYYVQDSINNLLISASEIDEQGFPAAPAAAGSPDIHREKD
jgi:hypothetical protein